MLDRDVVTFNLQLTCAAFLRDTNLKWPCYAILNASKTDLDHVHMYTEFSPPSFKKNNLQMHGNYGCTNMEILANNDDWFLTSNNKLVEMICTDGTTVDS